MAQLDIERSRRYSGARVPVLGDTIWITWLVRVRGKRIDCLDSSVHPLQRQCCFRLDMLHSRQRQNQIFLGVNWSNVVEIVAAHEKYVVVLVVVICLVLQFDLAHAAIARLGPADERINNRAAADHRVVEVSAPAIGELPRFQHPYRGPAGYPTTR